MYICHSHLEVGRHKGVVHDHHYVFVELMGQIRTGLDVHNLHGGIGGRLNPHQLQKEAECLGRCGKIVVLSFALFLLSLYL